MVEAAQKFPDPLDQSPPQVTPEQEIALEKQTKIGIRRFWRNSIIVLLILPVLTGIVVFGYQTYLDFTLRKEAEHRPAPVINKDVVVTVEPLPIATNSAGLLPGWKQYVNFKDKYSFGYPGEWFVVGKDNGAVTVQNVDPAIAPEQIFDPVKDPGKQQITFTLLSSSQRFTQTTQLESYIKNVDADSSIKLNVASTTALNTNSGLVAIKRMINRARGGQYGQAFVSVDGGVIELILVGDSTVEPEVFDQILRSIMKTSTVEDEVNQVWKVVKHSAGFELRYPDTVTATSQPTPIESSVKIEIQPNGNISASKLLLEVFDSEPPQTGTQSATRDFGEREFKVIEETSQIRYFGQLATGKWLQITLSYDSNIDIRKLLNQIIDTIQPDQPTQLP